MQVLEQLKLGLSFNLVIFLVYACSYGGTVGGFLTGYCGKKECGNWLMFYMIVIMTLLSVVLNILGAIMGGPFVPHLV